MVCTNILVTSCSKEDPASETLPTWKDELGTYAPGESHKLTINGKDDAPATKTVLLATGTGEDAKVTLTNIVPDNAIVEIDHVAITQKDNNTYALAGEVTVGTTTITISGSLTSGEDSNTLDLNVTRKITSPLAGTWKLNFTQAGGDIILNVKTTDDAFNELVNNMVGPMLSAILAQSVTDVTVSLGEDGTFDVRWTEAGQDASTGMPDNIKNIVSVYYFVSDGKLYLALEKSLFSLLAALMPEDSDIDLNAILSALSEENGGFIVNKGDFLALPIAFVQNSNEVRFSAGKSWVAVLTSVLLPLLQSDPSAELPEDIAELITQLPALINGSEYFDVSLGFKK
jgi:hypothetical protein